MFRLPQILCFSIPETKEADALMWSHYGNKWKGVRLGFDLLFENHRQVTYDTTSPYALSHVRYSKQRPVLDLSKIEDIGEDPLYSRYFYEMVSTKSEAWHYENEWRLFCDEPYSIEENGMRFWKFHNALLQTIDLGTNIDIGQQERLIGFSKEFFPHVAVRKVSMSSSGSEYDFKYCPLVDPRIQVQAKSTFKILAPPK